MIKCVESIRFLYHGYLEGIGVKLQNAIQLIPPPLVTSPADTDTVVLTDGALAFVAAMVRDFSGALGNFLQSAEVPICEAATGRMPAFSKKTEGLRRSKWKVETPRSSTHGSTVELMFAAADRRTMEEALRSGASSLLADLDDSQIPSWRSIIEGHMNIIDAARSLCNLSEGARGAEGTTLVVRPRGLRQIERHVLVDGGLVSAGMFDVGLFTYNTAEKMLSSGRQPHLCIPKMESHYEARAWNSMFDYIEMQLALPANFIKVTIQVDDISAIFDLDEIVAELKGRATCLSFDRWGYTFSLVRHFGIADGFILNEDSLAGRIPAYLDACEKYVAWTASRRGMSSTGMLPAHPPLCECSGDCLLPEIDREMQRGHDIIRVSDQRQIRALANACRSGSLASLADEFESDDEQVRRLLALPAPRVTIKGIRTSINSVLRFLASSLSAWDCISTGDDVASVSAVEACRSVLWQWARSKTITSDGRPVHGRFVGSLIDEELGLILKSVGGDERRRNYEKAALILKKTTSSPRFIPSILEYTHAGLVE